MVGAKACSKVVYWAYNLVVERVVDWVYLSVASKVYKLAAQSVVS